MAAYGRRAELTGEREPEQVKVGQVTWNFLLMLSAKPQLGEIFRAEEQGFSAARSMILSDALWRRRFGGDTQVIGKPVRMNGNSFTVVGVMPADFRIIFPEGSSVPPEMDVYIPFPADLAKQPADQGYIRVVGRLKRGVTPQQAQSEADEMASHMKAVSRVCGTGVEAAGGAAARRCCEKFTAGVAGTFFGSWLCAGDRLRERGEPAVVAGKSAAA